MTLTFRPQTQQPRGTLRGYSDHYNSKSLGLDRVGHDQSLKDGLVTYGLGILFEGQYC